MCEFHGIARASNLDAASLWMLTHMTVASRCLHWKKALSNSVEDIIDKN